MFTFNVTKSSAAKNLEESIKKLSRKQVYVGIPGEKGERKDGEITNVELMYIHSKGFAPLNIPARASIEPAIEQKETGQRIADKLKNAGQAVLGGDEEKADKNWNAAGQIAVNAAQAWFTDPRNGWPPNKPSTVRNKLRKLRGPAKANALAALAAGGDLTGIDTPLVDTDQLRKAITYVVGEEQDEKS